MNLPLEQHNTTTTTKYSCFIYSNYIGYKYLLSRAYNIKNNIKALDEELTNKIYKIELVL